MVHALIVYGNLFFLFIYPSFYICFNFKFNLFMFNHFKLVEFIFIF
jgi:hypothetical protein